MLDSQPKGINPESVFYPPTPKQIADTLKAKIFDFADHRIVYKPHIGDSLRSIGGEMHSPLGQLYNLYRSGLVPRYNEARMTGEYRTLPPYYSYPRQVVSVDMRASPHEIVEIIQQDKIAREAGVDDAIRDKIKNAQSVLLTGCIGATSAIFMVEQLHELGFKGKFKVVDISNAPLEILNAYKDLFQWRDRYGIEVETYVADLTQPWEMRGESFDVIFSDVLGTYLSDKQLMQGFVSTIDWRLKPDGIFLLRDMGETGFVPPEQKLVQNSADLEKVNENQDFQDWLKQYFDANVDTESIIQMKRNLFPVEKHEERGRYLNEMWDAALWQICKVRYVLNTAPVGVKQRIFPIMVAEKGAQLGRLIKNRLGINHDFASGYHHAMVDPA